MSDRTERNSNGEHVRVGLAPWERERLEASVLEFKVIFVPGMIVIMVVLAFVLG
jgi:hypothetical protein